MGIITPQQLHVLFVLLLYWNVIRTVPCFRYYWVQRPVLSTVEPAVLIDISFYAIPVDEAFRVQQSLEMSRCSVV